MRITRSTDRRFARLMAETQDGSSESYLALLTEVSEIMKGFLASRVLNNEDAEDILQEILISIHSARHTYDPARPFAPWVFSIAYHRLADYQRRAIRIKRQSAPENFDWSDLPSNDRSTETAKEDFLAILNQAGLTDSQQRIVTLLKMRGYSIKEAAQEMGMSESALKVAAHRAYKALRQKLEAPYP